jgi:hypothetical protein
MVAVLDSEFSWLTIVIGFMESSTAEGGTERQPLEESTNLWSFMMWVNWERKMIVDTVVEGGELSGL